MKTCIFLVALLCVSVGFANAVDENEEPVTDSQADCISAILRDIEVDLEGAGDLGEDAAATVRRLIEQRERCEAMLDDPPTAIQERLHA